MLDAYGVRASLRLASKERVCVVAQRVGVKDLIRRWVYTPRGARKVIAHRDFPAPEFSVNEGKTPVWFLPDVIAYERTHPELTSEAAKYGKVRGFAIANLKKKAKARTTG